MSHLVTLRGSGLSFAAAHFATFGGDCEPLHGHNYRLTVEIAGGLTDDSWVIDFREAKTLVRSICRELDHKFLLQENSRFLRVSLVADEYEITFGSRRYVMPKGDVAALPIDNSTAERLAEWLAARIAAALSAAGAANLSSVRVGVEEAPGQAGWSTLESNPAAAGPD
ncbi:MAG: 6-pyruvoyl tetrahydropterin synthase family protein [Chloroflexi bacterium]|nr:MAG: 6-pyruvoyl tetrahydropterin synthase family protein [Chloroflexota bacterium]